MGLWWGNDDEIIQIVQDAIDAPLLEVPVESICYRIEYFRCRPQAKWQHRVNIDLPLPLQCLQSMVVRLNGYQAICGLNIHLSHQCGSTQVRDYLGHLVHRGVSEGAECGVHPVVHALARGKGKMRDQSPFPRVVAFRDDSKPVELQLGGCKRAREWPQHAPQRNLPVEVTCDNLRVQIGGMHVCHCRHGIALPVEANPEAAGEALYDVVHECLVGVCLEGAGPLGHHQRGVDPREFWWGGYVRLPATVQAQ